jgi:hypothetical protein
MGPSLGKKKIAMAYSDFCVDLSVRRPVWHHPKPDRLFGGVAPASRQRNVANELYESASLPLLTRPDPNF